MTIHKLPENNPTDKVNRWRVWYYEVFLDLMANIKALTNHDSPVLAQLNDFSLFLQTEHMADLPPIKSFNIDKILKGILGKLKQTHDINSEIQLKIMLNPSMPHEWKGQPLMLEALLRHLLIIALERTKKGMILLRLETDSINNITCLKIKLEDSGPELQQIELKEWVKGKYEDLPPTYQHHHFSWLLTGRLFQHMGGNAQAENSSSGGLKLVGWLPVQAIVKKTKPQSNPLPINHNLYFPVKLVLAVENNKAKKLKIRSLLRDTSYQAFIVEDQQQALEWLTALPLSGIIINSEIKYSKTTLPFRIKKMIEEKIISEIPVFMITSDLSYSAAKELQKAGITDFLELPLNPEHIIELCYELPNIKEDFYRKSNDDLRKEMPEKVLKRLPELNKKFSLQIKELEKLLADETSRNILKSKIHAVKSAALTLGYFRLAAFMAQIEYAFEQKILWNDSENVEIIINCLRLSNISTVSN